MRSAAMLVLAISAACMESPAAAPVRAESAGVQAEAPVAATPESAAPFTPAKEAIPELSEEDLRLIAADPKDLTPDERRERAYALRRKVMQNPDSPAARVIKDMEEAVRNGEIDPNDMKKAMPTLSLPGSKPSSGTPPVGTRPPAGTAPAEAP